MLSNLKVLGVLGRRVQFSTSYKVGQHYFQASSNGCSQDKSVYMESEVHHDAKKNVFSIKAKQGTESAVLVYDWVDNGVIDFHHTEVPVVFRGHGVAKVLAKAGLDFAVRENLKVVLSCTYMAKYVADNPLPEYTKQLYSKM